MLHSQDKRTQTKECARCGKIFTVSNFARTRSVFYGDGLSPVCNTCLNEYLAHNSYSWETIDKLCRWLDIPFIVKEWERLAEINEQSLVWGVYSNVFASQAYETLGWLDYHNQYKKLREVGLLEEEVPLLQEEKMRKLRRKWGGNYEEEKLYYLEDLYKGLMQSEGASGALQIDQIKKLCKLSVEVDSRISAGDKDVDKFLNSYDKLVKMLGITPKNAKNENDFDSFAEVGLWLEKRGKQNRFYDGATRDVIDETLKNIEASNQRLYINEGGIGEEITQRLEALKYFQETEGAQPDENTEYYDVKGIDDFDEYDMTGFGGEDLEEFKIDEGDFDYE